MEQNVEWVGKEQSESQVSNKSQSVLSFKEGSSTAIGAKVWEEGYQKKDRYIFELA